MAVCGARQSSSPHRGLRLDSGDGRIGDLVLQDEDIDKLAVVALDPKMATGGGLVELGGAPHAIVCP